MPRPDPPVPGPGVQTFDNVPKSPADFTDALAEGAAAEAAAVLPPVGTFDDLPQAAAATPTVATTATTPSTFEPRSRENGKTISTS
jgi:hypothetical protein